MKSNNKIDKIHTDGLIEKWCYNPWRKFQNNSWRTTQFQNKKKTKQNDKKKMNKMKIFRATVNKQMTKHKQKEKSIIILGYTVNKQFDG